MLSRLHNATFNAWNSHAADAVVAGFAKAGTYTNATALGKGLTGAP
jgi:hypothetical protein